MNAAAFTVGFQQFTAERIGAAPTVHGVAIMSRHIRPTSKVFTLHRRMCDCDSLIGRGAEEQHEDEATAEDWLGWLRDLPDHAPHLSRIAVLRAWSPDYVTSTPARTLGIGIAAVDEAVLRDVGDEMLLTIDYRRTA
ncbi:hypothetical protein AAG589_08180 [Isoptericola sp. F-RaC21]|uniref:hypothetical protein n=1 Tax=Isoptericola sp. F-RaC21 TaxID=3141452 RepID=UPI00315B7C66